MRFREILVEANVLNMKDVDAFIAEHIPPNADPRIAQFFQRNLRRWLINNDEFHQQVVDVPDDAPAWAHEAADKDMLVSFQPNAGLNDFVSHLGDALTEIATVEPRLLDRLARLDPIGVRNLTDEFYARRRSQAVTVTHMPGEKPLIEYPDGARWIELTTPECMEYEGNLMGHCVGSIHRDHVGTGTNRYFSYRDAKNEPHITAHARGSELQEIKGKRNQPPVAKYIPRVVEFLNKLGFSNFPFDLQNTDIIRTKAGEFKQFLAGELPQVSSDLLDIRINPENHWMYVKGRGVQISSGRAVTADGYHRVILSSLRYDFAAQAADEIERIYLAYAKARNMTFPISMALNLARGRTREQAEKLFSGIKIGASSTAFGFHDSTIVVPDDVRALPKGVRFPGTLRLGGSDIEYLPEGLVVGRDLMLRDTKVKTLGRNTTVQRVLDLRGSLVEALPEGLTVGGKIGSRLDLRESRVKRLPDDLKIVVTKRATKDWSGRTSGGKIVVDRDDIEIPAHLQEFVERTKSKVKKRIA